MKKYTPNQVLDLVLSASEDAALSLLQAGLRAFQDPDVPYFSEDHNYEFGLDNWPDSHDWRISFSDTMLLLDKYVTKENERGRFLLFGATPYGYQEVI